MNDSFKAGLNKAAIVPVESLFTSSSKGTVKAVQSIYLDHFKPIYFIFDQFEELFIFGTKDEKLEFIKTVKAITESDIQCKFIFVIREEYLAGITEFEDHLPKIMLNRIRIEKLSQTRAAEVIDGPCRVAGIQVESGFTDELLDKLSPGGGEVELTYLQVFLDKIYQKASTGTEQIKFSLPMLNDLGNVSDVLGSYLDEQIKKLDDPEAGTTVLKSFVSLKGTKDR